MKTRAAWAVTAAVAVAVVASIAAVAAWKADSAPPGASSGVNVQTATVTRTQLSTTQTLSGTLGYGSAQSLTGSNDGVVTWLPASGALVSRGHPLYRVDNEPVPLFYGSTPLYRRLDVAGMVGPDVKVIADNLATLGYDIGYQPPVGSVITQAGPAASPSASRQAPSGSPTAKASANGGTAGPTPARPHTAASTPVPVTATVRPGDAVLTTALSQAIARWQAAEGLAPTGVLGVGDVLVEPGPVRVTALQAQLGDQTSGALMMVTSTTKTVTVAVDSTDVVSVRRSGRVKITLPDGSTANGTIIAVGTSVQSGESTTDGQPQQTVTVAPDDASAVASLTSAPVQVTFTGQTATGVLAVPVTALLALSGGGYALQLPDGRLIAAQTGMFARGMVQVSGAGIAAGLRVVTSG
jgi:hypothetical protein